MIKAMMMMMLIKKGHEFYRDTIEEVAGKSKIG